MIYYIVNFLTIIFLILLLARQAKTSILFSHFFLALFLKISTGLTLGLLYFYYYKGGDTIEYHKAAIQLNNIFSYSISDYIQILFSLVLAPIIENPTHVLVESRSLFFVKILSILYLITGNNYWITTIYFSFFSFLSSWALVNTISRYYKRLTIPAVIAFFYFIPGVFWTSGIIKESLAWFLIAYLMKLSLDFYFENPNSFKKLFLIVVLFIPLWMIKYHYAAALLISVSGLIFYKYILIIQRNKKIALYLLVLSYVIFGFVISQMHPNFQIDEIFEIMYKNQLKFESVSRPGTTISFIEYSDPTIRFIINIPISLFSGFFIPLPWQGDNILHKIIGIINLTILLLFIVKIIKIRKTFRPDFDIVFLSILIYCLTLSIFIAYSTPNFGTLERYKAGYISFFVMWVLAGNYILNLLRK